MRDERRGGGDAFMIAERRGEGDVREESGVGRRGGRGSTGKKIKGGGERPASHAPCRRGAANSSVSALAGTAADQPGRVRQWEVTPHHQTGTVAGRGWSPLCPPGPTTREGDGGGCSRRRATTPTSGKGGGRRGDGSRRPRHRLPRPKIGAAARAAAAGGGRTPPLPPPHVAHAAAGKLTCAASAGPAQAPATPPWLGHAGTHGIHALGRVEQAGGASWRGTQGLWNMACRGRAGGGASGRDSERGGAGRVTSAPQEGGGGGVFSPSLEVVATAAAWSHPRARTGCAYGRLTAQDLGCSRTTSPPPALNGGEAQTPNPLATTPGLLVSAGAQPIRARRRGACQPCRTAAGAGRSSPGGGWPPNWIEVLPVVVVEPLVPRSRAAQLNGDRVLAGLPRSSRPQAEGEI